MSSTIPASDRPRISRLVAQLVTPTNADDELNHLAGRSRHHDHNADPRDEHPWAPRRHVVVLQAPVMPSRPAT